jgi:hypothetical protein
MAPLSADRPISSLPLLKIATTMTVADPDVAAIWPLFIQAIQRGDINVDDIEPLLEALRRRGNHDVPGLRLRAEPDGGETILVASGLDSGRCAAEALVAAIEELRDGTAAVAPGAQPDGGNDGDDILGQLGRFFEQLPTTLPTGDELRSRLSTVRSAVGRLVSNAFSSEPGADQRAAEQTASLEAAIGQAGDDLARWTEARGDELTRALADVRDVAPARVAEGLRTLADWLEKRGTTADADATASADAGPDIGSRPGADTAAHIDALFASLGKSFGALFSPPAPGTDDDGDEPPPRLSKPDGDN